jgi:hypothetical protein
MLRAPGTPRTGATGMAEGMKGIILGFAFSIEDVA